MEWASAQLSGSQFTDGMVHNMEYSVLPLRTLLEEARVRPKGKWVQRRGRGHLGERPLDSAGKAMVAFKATIEAPRKEYGYFVRPVAPEG